MLAVLTTGQWSRWSDKRAGSPVVVTDSEAGDRLAVITVTDELYKIADL